MNAKKKLVIFEKAPIFMTATAYPTRPFTGLEITRSSEQIINYFPGQLNYAQRLASQV